MRERRERAGSPVPVEPAEAGVNQTHMSGHVFKRRQAATQTSPLLCSGPLLGQPRSRVVAPPFLLLLWLASIAWLYVRSQAIAPLSPFVPRSLLRCCFEASLPSVPPGIDGHHDVPRAHHDAPRPLWQQPRCRQPAHRRRQLESLQYSAPPRQSAGAVAAAAATSFRARQTFPSFACFAAPSPA